MAGAIVSASNCEWRTPDSILDPVRAFFGGEIDLDPCADKAHSIARSNLSLPGDGLAFDWVGSVFVNPPFGTSYVKGNQCLTAKALKDLVDAGKAKDFEWRAQKVSQWVEKAHKHDKDDTAETILLIPAAVDTAWWQHIILPAAPAICFIRGRVKFVGASQGLTMATALCYFGERSRRFKKTFAALGFCA